MNAYELADDLDNSNGLQYITKVGLVSLSSNMLRQQADRIAELEKELYFKNYYEELPDTPVGIQATPQTKPLSDGQIGSHCKHGYDLNKCLCPKCTNGIA